MRSQIITRRKKDKRKGILYTSIALAVTYVIFAAIILLDNMKVLTTKNVIIELGGMLMLMGSLAVYLVYADSEVVSNIRKVLTLCASMLISYCVIWAFDALMGSLDLAPFALCALILSLLVSNKCGFFANFIVIMIYYLQSICFEGGYLDSNMAEGFYLLFAGVMTSVFTVYVLGRHYRRLAYIGMGAVLGLIAAVSRAISHIMFNDFFIADVFFTKIALSFASGFIDIMLMFLLLPIMEYVFNVVSPFRFSEIATSNNQLMRMLFERAPGTYNHSLTVANYVEACASAIGENTFLARAAAYYHDIGKMKNPQFFTENQTDGVNPHDQMPPESSVNMIKNHTVAGLALAKEYHLPIEVQRAIVEHHGTMPLKYFYLKAQKYTDGHLPYDDYCYDGPKPSCKMSAILMICDACEAALRSSGDKAQAEKIVDGIVEERMEFDQFSECDITMKEIDIIKSTIITTYLGIKHQRVKYPEVKLEDDK